MISVASQSKQLHLEIVRDQLGFDALEAEWKALFELHPSSTTPLRWEWCSEWWRLFGSVPTPKAKKLQIITVRSGVGLKAVLPLYLDSPTSLAPRTLRFISSAEVGAGDLYPEYLDLLSEPEFTQSCIDLISDYLFKEIARTWDKFHLGILAPDSSLYGLAKSPSLQPVLRIREIPHRSWRANLSPSFDGYLRAISTSARKTYERVLKQVGQAGFDFSVARTPAQIDSFLSELIDLHQKRWVKEGMPGAFSSPEVVKFHQTISQKFIPRNQALLSRVSLNGVPLALNYGFVTKGKFDFYQSGVDISQNQLKSPGILAHLLTMQYLSTQDVHTYDFLAGNDNYKERLATSLLTLSELSLMRPTIRSILSELQTICSKLTNKVHSYICNYWPFNSPKSSTA